MNQQDELRTSIFRRSKSSKSKLCYTVITIRICFVAKLSCSTTWAFMFASVATLLAITLDRYLYIVKPLRYAHIVTHRRVFFAVSGIWITAC